MATDETVRLPLAGRVAFASNVSVAADVKCLFDRAESAFASPAHILVSCAGVSNAKYPPLAGTSVEDWDAIFSVNARGAFLCCREAAARLVRGGGGRIVTVSSSLVAALLPGYGAYAASKAAVEAMTKVLAKELRGTGVTANCVAPGPTATELFFAGKSEEDVRRLAEVSPLRRLGQPEDVAALVGFSCTDVGEWVNGQVVRVNGGFI
ncbi:NADPH-dependent aldehyde reductase-like protein, chloroplastic [Curcuma longa]|uniref:NADPH-dependent aldehyde reductase-like protein, chloroplastic n=1 Tax=Curcuma longa TaxID=136217 RepID=UPI003D9E4FF7